MNLLIFSDVHILEQDLPEIEVIFDELLLIKDKYCINKIIIAGDTFDKVNPTPKELNCFANFVKRVNIPIILIAAQSHESISPTENILTHFGILKSNLAVSSEYIDEKDLYVGHFIVKQSSSNFGGTVDKETLKQYKHVLLGHGHNFEIIKPNICQLGSVRFIDFGENPEIHKKIAICENYKEDTERWHFIGLNSPYPMKNIELNKKAIIDPIANDLSDKKIAGEGKESGFLGKFEAIKDLTTHLDKLDPKTKIRIIFKDYSLWREFLPIYHVYKQKFIVFRDKKDFLIQPIVEVVSEKKENKSLKESLIQFMKDNKVEQFIQDILLNEIIKESMKCKKGYGEHNYCIINTKTGKMTCCNCGQEKLK